MNNLVSHTQLCSWRLDLPSSITFRLINCAQSATFPWSLHSIGVVLPSLHFPPASTAFIHWECAKFAYLPSSLLWRLIRCPFPPGQGIGQSFVCSKSPP